MSKFMKLIALVVSAIVLVSVMSEPPHLDTFDKRSCNLSISEMEDGEVSFSWDAKSVSEECANWIVSLETEGKGKSFEWVLKQLNNN